MSSIAGAAEIGRERGRVRRWASSGVGVWLAAAFLGIVVIGAILAPVVAPYAPAAVDLANPSAGPGSEHLLGTDALGRDIASRLLWGGRSALIGPAILVVAAAVIGSALGISSAWRGGVYDAIASRAIDILFAFPSLIIALILIALSEPGLQTAILGLLPGYAAFIARVVRSVALRERNLPYVAACITQGQGGMRICTRHLLPNLFPVILTQCAASMSYALIDLAALSFLGVGVQGSTPDWGVMLADAQSNVIKGDTGELVVVGLVFVMAVVSLNVLSDRSVMRQERLRAGH
jgi:peptide/nickel transport system permease protein